VTRLVSVLLLLTLAACESRSQAVSDPISGIPANQQRRIAKRDIGWEWPLTVTVGTLGCGGGAVVFANGGAAYALNDAARAKGFASIRPLQLSVHPKPTNPLSRITQDTRMQIFARVATCAPPGAGDARDACRQAVREKHGLSEEELKQIEAEGNERHWLPHAPQLRSVAPLIDAGLKLCPA
jgi:hypothetical protein